MALPSIHQLHIDEPGQKLRRTRERLRLKYRDVEEASQKIAVRRQNDEFTIGLSRLADIENKGTVPSIYRLYSLCAIYRLNFSEVLDWYGINLGQMADDALSITLDQTHLVQLSVAENVEIELPLATAEVDLRKTHFISHNLQRWGKLPMLLLDSFDPKRQRYGFIGSDDWSMYPILSPGSFVQIDEGKRRIVNEGWANEYERPIYFFEHREGYHCCWCSDLDGTLLLQPHSASHVAPQVFRYPGEIEIVGQVVAIAKRLDFTRRRHTRQEHARRDSER